MRKNSTKIEKKQPCLRNIAILCARRLLEHYEAFKSELLQGRGVTQLLACYVFPVMDLKTIS